MITVPIPLTSLHWDIDCKIVPNITQDQLSEIIKLREEYITYAIQQYNNILGFKQFLDNSGRTDLVTLL